MTFRKQFLTVFDVVIDVSISESVEKNFFVVNLIAFLHHSKSEIMNILRITLSTALFLVCHGSVSPYYYF